MKVRELIVLNTTLKPDIKSSYFNLGFHNSR